MMVSRDDIEAFIDALEVPEPVRKSLKAKCPLHTRKTSINDFSQKTDANIKKALDISRLSQYDKVLACEEFVGIDIGWRHKHLQHNHISLTLLQHQSSRTSAWRT